MTATEIDWVGTFPRFQAGYWDEPAPGPDFDLSPITGVTREHWASYADDLLMTADRYRSPQGARIDFPGEPSVQGERSDGLEGFARTFLLEAFRHVGEPNGGRRHAFLSRYLDGVVAGTRSVGADDAESWPVIGRVGRHGQPMVESASIALSLHLTKADTWDRLDAGEQDRLESWLREALRHEPSPNNWYLFPTTVASFLEGVGRADDETGRAIERGLSLAERWYRGDGWYSDGDGEIYDHYIGWALHYYPMLHALLRHDDELSARYGERLERFLESFELTFDRNGAPLHFGRSLTYRTGTVASIALGAITGHTPLSAGQSRSLMSKNLRYFAERGSRTDGVLSLGWHGPHQATVQPYSGPGSPYWASKGFAALMLPADHPLWTATEAEPQHEHEDVVRSVGPTGMLIQRTAADGLVRVHNHGSDNLKSHHADSGGPDPLYGRFGYSTRTGPTALHNPSSNDVQVQFEDTWSVRRRIHHVAGGADWMASWHAPRFPVPSPYWASPYSDGGPVLPSARIQSVVVVRGAIEVHAHRCVDVPTRTPLRMSGWPASAPRPGDIVTRFEANDTGVQATSTTDDGVLVSRLNGVVGWGSASTRIAPAGTAFGPWSVVPELTTITEAGQIHVAVSELTGEVSSRHEPPTASVSGATLTVQWADTHEPATFDFDTIFPDAVPPR